MFKYVPQNMSVVINNLQSSEVGYALLDYYPRAKLTIKESPDVRRLHVSRNSKLTELSMDRTRVSSIKSELNKNLRSLAIIDSLMKSISPSIVNVIHLEILIIDDGLLRELDLGVFCGLHRLNVLSLRTNKIKYIVFRAKSALCRLAMYQVNLANNFIKVLNLELFNRCDSLYNLELYTNEIELVTGRFVNDVIKHINLCFNRIKQMNLCQWETPLLVELNLNANLLSAMPTCIDKIKSLETIRMSYNNLTHLDSSWLEPLENLKFFGLGQNNLAAVTLPIFPNQLEILNLIGNGLKVDDLLIADSKVCIQLEFDTCIPYNVSGVS
ncbi:carboxypeptidase N subunit 2-like [Anopheles albimanus]|uniref:carboxypeptidase N subunit 2-like n=1 Tax=Anopheles albimanus TaxID=7167 RepID=UPI00163EA45A|nr:carboxypeptidase N subunit 2-like [Anopheles albimanus]XP_035777333.1 carboxypeptidase N subunit 2-like [Anopheles albimanus]XP_035777334.1 carboxypeptidase N subunit 2-like [Anopheles albimanus]